MDLSQGSSPQTKDFIDLMNHPHQEEEEEEENQSGHGGSGNGINKKDEIFPSYDFQPIRPIASAGAGLGGGSSQSPNLDATPSIGGSTRAWNSGDSMPKTAALIRVITNKPFLFLKFISGYSYNY